jgi:hypothetical protein
VRKRETRRGVLPSPHSAQRVAIDRHDAIVARRDFTLQ